MSIVINTLESIRQERDEEIEQKYRAEHEVASNKYVSHYLICLHHRVVWPLVDQNQTVQHEEHFIRVA